ncbi:MarR family winged helix-turn-helix transcriptional regulator [Kocuria rosea]|uniref:MarR family winged helix-turn-helix transcriptional regulator n=1 Tax=Kocuria rosea TaxID=1275 RepID=UPI00203CE753|nr:MarR family transcriptional regulator [Kocuria rosea]MCM3687099.1 MarR family transcriptional regulator [Kocuria rosea]
MADSSTAILQDEDPVTLWGHVIEGFQCTHKNLHHRVTATFSLDPAEAEALLRLSSSSEQRMPMAELARQVAFSTGGATKVADRLVKRHLARRVPCATDRRVVYLELTTEGQATSRALRELVGNVVSATFVDVLGPEKAALVADAMAHLAVANRRPT